MITPAPRRSWRPASWAAMAAAFPRKMPAGSRPERRRPSRAPSLDSMAKLRCTARRELKRTATQNRPAAALVNTPRSGSRAKANRTSTRMAKGATWLVVTREWPSMRRSLPATRPASRHMGGRFRGDCGRRCVGNHPAAGDGDSAGGEGAGPLVLVGCEHHGGAAGGGAAHDPVEEVAVLGVEAGVGFVEQPQLGPA